MDRSLFGIVGEDFGRGEHCAFLQSLDYGNNSFICYDGLAFCLAFKTHDKILNDATPATELIDF